MLSRPDGFLYHVNTGSGRARTPRSRSVAINKGATGSALRGAKRFYCLDADLAELRTIGAGKGIVDASVTDVGNSTEGKPIRAIKIGNGPHACVITGCYHAREWISVEVPFLIAEYLVTAYPAGAPADLAEKRLKHLLHNRTVWIVPMVNPDGHEMSLAQNRFWRANTKTWRPSDPGMPPSPFTPPVAQGETSPGRSFTYDRSGGAFYKGVDCNRNHACADASARWGDETFAPADPSRAKTSRNPADCAQSNVSGNTVGLQVWCGPSAASEVETQALEALARTANVKTSLHFHSCFGVYLYPEIFRTAGDNFTKWLGRGMQELNRQAPGAKSYALGSARSIMYAATGSAMDFYREASGGMPAYTPEVRPLAADLSADNQFSFLPENEIWPTFLENLAPALAVINAAGHAGPAGDREADVVSAKPAARAQAVRNCWQVFRGWPYPARPGP